MPKGDSRYEAGLAVRNEVLGPEYVERSLASVDHFSQALQDHLNEFCWGLAWTRPDLDRRTRSLLTLGVLATLGKPNEIKAHTLGALRNGCTPAEIREVFLHVAVYAGVPAAVEAFRAAAPVIAEEAAE
jgi:4-carboxymuconolactone decarboxylase